MIIRKAILILALLGITQIPTLHHDNLDGFVAGEHIKWTAKTPSSSNDTGTVGQFAFDNSYIYAYGTDGLWRKTALSTWGITTDVLLLDDGTSKLLLSDGASFLLIRI